MDSLEQDLFKLIGQPGSIVDYLNSLSFDELVEIDLFNNRIRNLFHVEGKYFVPVITGSYKDLYRYSGDNMIHPEDRYVQKHFMDHETMLDRLANSDIPGVISAEFRYRLQNGGWCWVKQVIVGGHQHGLPDGVIRFYVFDIQNKKQRELGEVITGQYRESDVRDNLTGLRRERDFFSVVRDLILRKDHCDWCLVDIDIDQFKLFNDWYGREAGDFVLAKIGALLVRHEMDDNWIGGYIGQDDFCVLMPHDDQAIQDLYTEISKTIAEYGTSKSFLPTFGICMVGDAEAVLDLYDCAKLASNAAKGDVRHHIRFYEPEMYRQTDAEYRLLAEFQDAIANHEIFYALQPQCRLSTGQIVGAEALARWRKKGGEIIQPNEFTPILEKHGFITDLDRYIWREACAHLRALIDSGLSPVPISVNVSRLDIYNLDVAEHFSQLIEEYDLDPSMVKIEITESAYVDDLDKVNETVKQLRDRGFYVLIDDFGSGYSSLNMLDNINVDVIKLDMCFLRMNETDKNKSVRILESTVGMAKALGLVVITEGVETHEQAEFLRSIGCRYVQGYYCYRPMASEDFDQLLYDEALIDRNGFRIKSNEEFHIREFLDQNVYSDAMLNNLLGAVAIFSWRDDNVDIIRFNEQFYEEVGIEGVEGRLEHNQNYVDKINIDRYFGLLCDAMEDELNGATDIIRYRRIDGTPLDFHMHFYYLGEIDSSKRFYVTVRNITQLTELRDQMKLMSYVSDNTVAFLTYHQDGWRFKVGIHGLEDELGLSRVELEAELENRSFFERFEEENRDYLRTLSFAPDDKLGNFTMPLNITTDHAGVVETTLKSFCVQDERNVFSYVLVLVMR